MKRNIYLLILGICFFILPAFYASLELKLGRIFELLLCIYFLVGFGCIKLYYFDKKRYKKGDLRSGKIFEIKSIYKTPWENRVGICFSDNEKQYYLDPIPDELMDAVCGEKYFKRKNIIIKAI